MENDKNLQVGWKQCLELRLGLKLAKIVIDLTSHRAQNNYFRKFDTLIRSF